MPEFDLTERRAKFVYEASRLAAIAAQAPIIPERLAYFPFERGVE